MARTVAARWTTVALAAPRPAGTVTYCATARLLSAGSSVYVEPTGVSNLASYIRGASRSRLYNEESAVSAESADSADAPTLFIRISGTTPSSATSAAISPTDSWNEGRSPYSELGSKPNPASKNR